MKTRGLAVSHGYLHGQGDTVEKCNETSSGYGFVPPQLWHRLKHRLGLKGLLDTFAVEARAAKSSLDRGQSEQALFRRWCGVVDYAPPAGSYGEPLWPWSRGWTEDLVDTYLEPQP